MKNGVAGDTYVMSNLGVVKVKELAGIDGVRVVEEIRDVGTYATSIGDVDVVEGATHASGKRITTQRGYSCVVADSQRVLMADRSFKPARELTRGERLAIHYSASPLVTSASDAPKFGRQEEALLLGVLAHNGKLIRDENGTVKAVELAFYNRFEQEMATWFHGFMIRLVTPDPDPEASAPEEPAEVVEAEGLSDEEKTALETVEAPKREIAANIVGDEFITRVTYTDHEVIEWVESFGNLDAPASFVKYVGMQDRVFIAAFLTGLLSSLGDLMTIEPEDLPKSLRKRKGAMFMATDAMADFIQGLVVLAGSLGGKNRLEYSKVGDMYFLYAVDTMPLHYYDATDIVASVEDVEVDALYSVKQTENPMAFVASGLVLQSD